MGGGHHWCASADGLRHCRGCCDFIPPVQRASRVVGMTALGQRERETLGFIRTKFKADGIAPTYQEIAAHLGINSKSRALYIVDALVAAGHVRRPFAGFGVRARAIELVETEDNHASDCSCGVCAHARYLAQLKLVQAIQVSPPWALSHSSGTFLHNIAPVSELTKVYWLRGFPKSLRPQIKRGAA
jgi:SOS-response transcriptional repressor LexA